jgi:hypothetical protein
MARAQKWLLKMRSKSRSIQPILIAVHGSGLEHCSSAVIEIAGSMSGLVQVTLRSPKTSVVRGRCYPFMHSMRNARSSWESFFDQCCEVKMSSKLSMVWQLHKHQHQQQSLGPKNSGAELTASCKRELELSQSEHAHSGNTLLFHAEVRFSNLL